MINRCFYIHHSIQIFFLIDILEKIESSTKLIIKINQYKQQIVEFNNVCNNEKKNLNNIVNRNNVENGYQ